MDLTAGLLTLIGAAFVLGVLHGLEPGHGKSIMGAYIVASRGGIRHALLLGLVVTITHTALIYILAIVALVLSQGRENPHVGWWLEIVSGALVVGVGIYMILRSFGLLNRHPGHGHGHPHPHVHGHAEETKRIATEHGAVELSIFEEGVPPRFRLRFDGHNPPPAETVTLETIRDDATRQVFAFADRGDFLESTVEIPEPHQFSVTLTLTHGGHAHAHPTRFVEHDHGHSDHAHPHAGGDGSHDHHDNAHGHAHEVRLPEGRDPLGFWTLVGVGVSGGIVPCPAALTAFLAAMNMGRVTAGIAIVAALSLGIAVTLMSIGILFVKAREWADRKFAGRGLATHLPRISAIVITLLGAALIARAVLGHHP